VAYNAIVVATNTPEGRVFRHAVVSEVRDNKVQ
jgi:hypothetical protein